MINSAKEAKLKIHLWEDEELGSMFDVREAEGYLAALQGPEVKALVEALEKNEQLWGDVGLVTKAELCEEIAPEIIDEIKQALAQWHSLQRKEK